MKEAHSSPERIAELLIHLGRAARSEDATSDLTAAQWTCLRFFARANASTRTPSSFARFQSTTRGTASQIIKTLESRGLIRRTRSEIDKRSVIFDLTQHGHALLERDPLRDIVAAIGTISSPERRRFLGVLSRLASDLATHRSEPAFGTCEDCSHFGERGERAYCACMSVDLEQKDISMLCVNFTPALAPKTTGERNAGH